MNAYRALVRLVTIAFVVLSMAVPVFAQGPGNVYVDPDYDGNESGTQDNPYDSEEEAIAYLQSLPNGGYLYVRSGEEWARTQYIPPVTSGGMGSPIPPLLLFVLLTMLALGLVVIGWRLMRRPRSA